ncbi:acyltransferase family protein [Arthrobacter roseus]|uniref:acyltransferase family protein n=1 Tax=Arthrobacter roseus TaxID=136274 RepID=UPI001EF8EC15|nr:acyltransferase family protein [Arthrobacter roseus]MBM7849097.1 peptidoglycan/LPS O-acetylase OafA/YrhL [Arthrobacter roseus]
MTTNPALAPERPVTPAAAHPAGPRYRPEVQGLRALAVLMVVTYHIWFGRVSGGVDVFLLISSFLLTFSFTRKIENGIPLRLGKYWLHLFKRLLPAVVVTLLGVLAATYLFIPQSRWPEILGQSWASLLYFQNWVLAFNSVDYYAADHSQASPLQHFWSLSVQGQVFILWPLLFAFAAFLTKLLKARFRFVVLAVFGAVFLGSLTFSIVETYTNQTFAYFDTRARLWEFALGTLLALALPFLRIPAALRVVMGWVGLAAMLSGGFVLDVQGEFPGYVALWPTLAAGFIIVAGQTGSRFGADRLLSWRPLVRMGDISYALYLWHWPILITYLIFRDRTAVGIVGGTGIIGLALVLAYLTTRFIERPIRESQWAEKKRRRAAVIIAVCVALVVVPVVGWQLQLRAHAAELAKMASVNNPGARVLMDGFEGKSPAGVEILPAAADIQKEYAGLDGKCENAPFVPQADVLEGRCADTQVSGEPARTLVVVGDSHTEQWLGAIEPMARAQNWKVVSLLLGGCTYSVGFEGGYKECNEFNAAATDYIKELHPDAVFTVATSAHREDPQDTIVSGLANAANLLRSEGIQLIGIRDNPRFTFNMMECVELHGEDSDKCNPPRSTVLSSAPPFEELRAVAPDIKLMDVTDLICREDVCPAVVGNIYVYIDDNHLTETYVESMRPEFDQRFRAAVRW